MPVDRERLRETFLELVRTPSPSLHERAVADLVIGRLEKLGYQVTEDQAGQVIGGEAGNLFVRVPANGDGPRLFVSAHLDTVESGKEAVEPVVDGVTVTSAGDTILGADDKCGVAALVELLALLHEDRIPHGELLACFTVAEEVELLGASAMNPEWFQGFDAGIVLDHSLPNEFIVGAPSKVALRLRVEGVGGHAAFPERRVNAAHALATAVSRLSSGRLDDFSTGNLGIIHSGSRINVIPERAYAEYELRSHRKDLLDFHLQRTLSILEAAVREARVFVADVPERAAAGEGASPLRRAMIEVEVEACYEAYRLSGEALPVRLLSAAIHSCGLEPAPVIAQGGSDANIFNSHGLPCAVLGCGMHGAHSSRERADLAEIAGAVEVLVQAIRGS